VDTVDTSEFFTLYPHIAGKIRKLWGTKDCRDLLLSLLNDSREGKRAGFPPSIGKTIFSLSKAHDKSFPQFDDTDHIIVPFEMARTAPVVNQPYDWGFVATIAKIIAFILIAAIFYKVYVRL